MIKQMKPKDAKITKVKPYSWNGTVDKSGSLSSYDPVEHNNNISSITYCISQYPYNTIGLPAV